MLLQAYTSFTKLCHISMEEYLDFSAARSDYSRLGYQALGYIKHSLYTSIREF